LLCLTARVAGISGEGWDAGARRWLPAHDDSSTERWPVAQWVDDGARLVGGGTTRPRR